MKTKYYHTFEKLVNDETSWKNILEVSNEATNAAISTTLLNDYVIPRYSDAIVMISEDETPEFKVIKKKMLAWLNSTYEYYSKIIPLYVAQESNLMNKLQTVISDSRTSEKTGSNSNTYSAGEQHSKVRENDTPQNGGDWSDDEHTSTLTVSDYDGYTNLNDATYQDSTSQTGNMTTSVDPDTIMARLHEIREKYVNLYQEWAEYFSIFVYYPADFENKNEYGFIYYTDEEE